MFFPLISFLQLLGCEDKDSPGDLKEQDKDGWTTTSGRIIDCPEEVEQLLALSPDNLGNTSPKLVMGVPRDVWDENVAKGRVNFEENIRKNLENNEVLDFYQSVQLRGKSLMGSSSNDSKKGKKIKGMGDVLTTIQVHLGTAEEG